MKWLGQSRNNPQLWMCLVVKVKSNVVKKNITQETGMLGHESRQIGCSKVADGKSKHQNLRNQ